MSETTDWYGPEAATFGDRLAASREASGMTQSDLARRMGIRLKTLQSWEQDVSEPRANRLATCAGLLNVSMGWLITGEGEGVSPPEEVTIPADLEALLLEIRAMQVEMKASAERLARLEKSLRRHLIAAAG